MNLTDIEDITFEFRFCSIYYVDVDEEILYHSIIYFQILKETFYTQAMLHFSCRNL